MVETAEYRAPAATRIGHVHLKVSDLDRSVAFYQDLLGFEVMARYGSQAAFLSAGGYHHHLGLNTWESLGAPPATRRAPGLYHFAINFPERVDLARAVRRLVESGWPIGGSSDHGTHEAIYLDDPDGNGIELAWDRDPSFWYEKDGNLRMVIEPLNYQSLMAELETTPAE